MKRFLCGLAALGLLVGVAGHVRGQPSWDFTIIDMPNVTEIHATGIDNAGNIWGWFTRDGTQHAFKRAPDGIITVYDNPGATSTAFLGITPSGTTAVGIGTGADGASYAFTYDVDQDSYSDYVDPDTILSFFTAASDVLKRVGISIDFSFITHGLLDDNWTRTRVDVPGADGTSLLGISPSGNMATGSHVSQGAEHGLLSCSWALRVT